MPDPMPTMDARLTPEQIEKLTELVYRLLQRDLLRQRERAGRDNDRWR